MSLGMNNAIYSFQGIDTKNVNNTAAQILNNAQKSSEVKVEGFDYSKFNRASLGVDLYSSRTNSELQKQIALTQAGLYLQSVNVAKLNSQAALNLYSANTVQKQVELTQSVLSNELTAPKALEKTESTIQLFNTSDKNSNSSNGFNPFEANQEESLKEKQGKHEISLFA